MGVEMRILKPLGQVRAPADGAQPSHRRRVRAPQPRERRRGHALLRTLSAAHGGLAVTTPTGPGGHFLPDSKVVNQVGNSPDTRKSEVASLTR